MLVCPLLCGVLSVEAQEVIRVPVDLVWGTGTMSVDTLSQGDTKRFDYMQWQDSVGNPDSEVATQSVHHHTEVSTNLLYLATATPNITIDLGFARRWSLALTAGYNPWKYASYTNDMNKTVNPKTMHWLVMPELRLWFHEHLQGGWIGLQAFYADYNIGGIKMISGIKNHRYDGNLWGQGLALGWHWWLGRKHRTGMNAYVGVGWVRVNYDEYKACQCSDLQESVERTYIGPTRLGLSLTYMIK